MKVLSLHRSLPVLTLALIGAFFVGCASRNNPAVHFQPVVSNSLPGIPKSTLRVASIEDWRSGHSNAVLGQQRNGHGYTTSDVVAAQGPIAQIFRSGLVYALEENNYKIAPGSGKYELRGGIQDFTCNQVHGFWDATGKSQLQVRFELVNTMTGNSVWQKSYIGHGTISTPWSAKGTMANMFSESATDVVGQLLADDSFRRYFENRN